MSRAWRTALALLALALLGLGTAGCKETSELPVYVVGAERMQQGEPIYRPTDLKPFTYPPFFALPFVPLASVPQGAQRPLWVVMNVLMLAGVVLLVMRLLHARVSAPRARMWCWVAIASLSARHVSAVFENQSHDLLVFLVVAAGAYAWVQRREGAAAGAWGIAAACKATPLLFLVPLVVRVRVVAAGALVLAFALATLLPDLLFPQASGELWVVSWFKTFLSGLSAGGTAQAQGAWTAGSFLNQSLSGTLHRLLTVETGTGPFVRDVALVDLGPSAKKAVILVAQALVLLVVALCARARDRLAMASAVVCGMVLLSPMSSKSHFCVLLLPAAFTVMAWLARRDRWLLVLLVLQFVLGTLTMKGLLGSSLGNAFLAHGSVTWTALLALLATWRGTQVSGASVPPVDARE